MKKSFEQFRNEKTIMNAQQYEEEYGAYIGGEGEFAWVYEDGLNITINMDGTLTLVLDRSSYTNGNRTLKDLEEILYDYACNHLWESSEDITTKCIEEAFKTINFNFIPSSFEFGDSLREFADMVHEQTYHFLCRKWMTEAGFHNISLDEIDEEMLVDKFGDDWERKLIEQLLLIRMQDFIR
jgi:hypothetical protein